MPPLFDDSADGAFLRFMDRIVERARFAIALGVFLIVYPFWAIGHLGYGYYGRWFHDSTVYLFELNPTLRAASPTLGDYGTFHSVAEAEDWLLHNGYSCREVYTRYTPSGPEIDYSKMPLPAGWKQSDMLYYGHLKTFPTKGIPGNEKESVVDVVVATGDGARHEVFFENDDCQCQFDFSRFQRIEVPKTRAGTATAFELCQYSTQGFSKDWFASMMDTDWLTTGQYRIQRTYPATDYESPRE